jgi:hypothetical protein
LDGYAVTLYWQKVWGQKYFYGNLCGIVFSSKNSFLAFSLCEGYAGIVLFMNISVAQLFFQTALPSTLGLFVSLR